MILVVVPWISYFILFVSFCVIKNLRVFRMVHQKNPKTIIIVTLSQFSSNLWEIQKFTPKLFTAELWKKS